MHNHKWQIKCIKMHLRTVILNIAVGNRDSMICQKSKKTNFHSSYFIFSFTKILNYKTFKITVFMWALANVEWGHQKLYRVVFGPSPWPCLMKYFECWPCIREGSSASWHWGTRNQWHASVTEQSLVFVLPELSLCLLQLKQESLFIFCSLFIFSLWEISHR